jgi:UDP-N-acetylmuramoyl-L-alanyl-D-glutamate--2,6-diaminopimelate ligase
MKLSVLVDGLSDFKIIRPSGEKMATVSDPEVLSIHYQSKEVTPGGLFVALKGQHTDGHHYIGDAVFRGAAAVVISDRAFVNIDVPVIMVENTRKALAAISSRFYGDPSNFLFIIGITGTNGKTTTAYLIEQILQENGYSVGIIGTVNYRYQAKQYPNPLTTPESLELQKILSEMRDAGVTHVAMEVSSHGVAMDRIANCWFDIGVFTNLSQDHLDFHKDMENYWSCKRKFFSEYLPYGPKGQKAMAVINTDDQKGRELIHSLDQIEKIPVGYDELNMIRPEKIHFDQTGIKGNIRCPAGGIALDSKLVGRFNLENILCATGVAVAMGIPMDVIAGGIQSFIHAPGRLEKIANNVDRHVFVDYAHTPDALENVLATLKEILSGRLICVFGCGGDRDKTKRPKMGSIAAKFSDLVIITSDNPRTEDPASIIEDIKKGIEPTGLPQYVPGEIEAGFENKGFVVEPDRKKAIFLGIKTSREGDTVLIAGKGHETYQLIGKQVLPFDDREKASAALMMN